MKVLVIGAGVVGTCTALSLRRRGHEVMLIDAAAGPATGASHANAGEPAAACKAIPLYVYANAQRPNGLVRPRAVARAMRDGRP